MTSRERRQAGLTPLTKRTGAVEDAKQSVFDPPIAVWGEV